MILSVSRRTDIPAFYSDWFYERIKEGYAYVKNPMNIHQVGKISLSPDVVDCIVFWTKNPKPMMARLDELAAYSYYFQFTLDGYGKDAEPYLPPKNTELIETFRNLSGKIGKNRVIWRYDPIFINDRYTVDYHRKAFSQIAEALDGYTDLVIISFIDMYAKTARNTKDLHIKDEIDSELLALAKDMADIAHAHHMTIESCAEKIDLANIGIEHGHCIDKKRIEQLIGCRLSLGKDKVQRAECGCFASVDIGAYNTCLHGCKYCYANFNPDRVKKNAAMYDKSSQILCDTIGPEDKIYDRKAESNKVLQMDLFDLL